jgi:hypothetical protein
LFIAIARAAGIPAREINGYAYTENPEIQPLSLVSDVLHSWPQYWSEDRHAWISVDPTWESTSGINFFDHLDLRHIAFVIHGTDDSLPLAPGLYKVGDNPQKDVFVSFGQLSSSSDENPIITSHISKKIWPFVNTYTFRIENKSKTAVYDRTAAVYFDDKKVQTFSGIQIPPGGNFQKSVDINFGLWKKEIPGGVHTDVDGLFSDVTQTHKESYQLFQLILIFVLFILILINTILKGTRKKIVKTIFMKK